ATGTSSTPASGTSNGRAPRSPSTASAPNTITSTAARTAQVRRHALANAIATTTGTNRATASTARSVGPISNDARASSPRPGSPSGGAPVSSAHVHVVTHGALSSTPTSAAPIPQVANQAATRHEASANRVPS